MFKELFALQPLIKRVKKANISSLKDFLAACDDPVKSEELRKNLEINVTPEQWSGAVAVVKELFK